MFLSIYSIIFLVINSILIVINSMFNVMAIFNFGTKEIMAFSLLEELVMFKFITR